MNERDKNVPDSKYKILVNWLNKLKNSSVPTNSTGALEIKISYNFRYGDSNNMSPSPYTPSLRSLPPESKETLCQNEIQSIKNQLDKVFRQLNDLTEQINELRQNCCKPIQTNDSTDPLKIANNDLEISQTLFPGEPKAIRCQQCNHRCIYCLQCFDIDEKLLREYQRKMGSTRPWYLNLVEHLSALGNISNFMGKKKVSTKCACCQTDAVNSTNPANNHPENSNTTPKETRDMNSKTKNRWILIRIDHAENNSKAVTLVEDCDIPENTILIAK